MTKQKPQGFQPGHTFNKVEHPREKLNVRISFDEKNILLEAKKEHKLKQMTQALSLIIRFYDENYRKLK